MTCQNYFKGKDVIVFMGAENSQFTNDPDGSMDSSGIGTETAGDATRTSIQDVKTAFELPIEITNVTSFGVDGFGLEFEDIDVLGRPVPINVEIRNEVAATIEKQMSGFQREFFLLAGLENPLGACAPVSGTYNDKGNSTKESQGFFDDTYGYWVAARVGILPTEEIWIVFHNCKIETTPTVNAGGTNTESIVFMGRYGEVKTVSGNGTDSSAPFNWYVDSDKYARIAHMSGTPTDVAENSGYGVTTGRAIGVRIPTDHTGDETALGEYVHVYSDATASGTWPTQEQV